MQNKLLLDANDVAKLLGVSDSYAYKIIKSLNSELKKDGYLTISGKVSSNYLKTKLFGDVSDQIGGTINASI